jgi:undecaprenyl diphosphate synthase
MGAAHIEKQVQKKDATVQDDKESSFRTCARHVAIVMDGNRRWAKARGLHPYAGHLAGVQALEKVIKAAMETGIAVLTVYAFSKENWSRGDQEVSALMNLLSEQIQEKTPQAIQQGIRIRIIGDRASLPEKLQHAINYVETQTQKGCILDLCIALNYGARNEVVRAVQKIAQKVQQHEIEPGDIREWHLSEALDTFGLGDPDLFIRTSGEHRLSNFLLWQMAYTELYFASCAWPDFEPLHFYEALQAFEGRKRRYGA